MKKPINPYMTLKREFEEWIRKVMTRRVVSMWVYPADTIGTTKCNLMNLSERVQAAEQLGYGVRLRWTDAGLIVEYVEKLPRTPWWYA